MSTLNTKIKKVSIKKQILISVASIAFLVGATDITKNAYDTHERNIELHEKELISENLLQNLSENERKTYIVNLINTLFNNNVSHFNHEAWTKTNFTEEGYNSFFKTDLNKDLFKAIKSNTVSVILDKDNLDNNLKLVGQKNEGDFNLYQYNVPIRIEYKTSQGIITATQTQLLSIVLEQYKSSSSYTVKSLASLNEDILLNIQAWNSLKEIEKLKKN